ncbi:MAG: RNA methyltransferase [Bdellovibrionaceae bacterium]|nr:RNA methyltransferase [Pseudobdellovibrionaceae bacterium]MDW8191095.1 RNA methyltransferase [Pseudobdellovibrionaceae bacterium]
MKPCEVTVVLVRPLYEWNVGSVSRAMVNMGFESLCLINPQCSIGEWARKAAANGQAPLDHMVTYSSWFDFHKEHPNGIRLAFTNKDGQSRIVSPIADVLMDLKERDLFALHGNQLYLFFGPEDWGLNNDDISWCHRSVVLPTFGLQSSMNLSHAVLLALFLLRQYILPAQTTPFKQRTFQNDFVQEGEWFPDQSFRKFLLGLGLKLDDRRVSIYSALRQYFLRALPTRREKRMLQIIFEQGARKIKRNWSS